MPNGSRSSDPYPDWLTAASRAYWDGLEYEIVSWGTMPDDTSDTVNIYSLNSAGFLRASETLETAAADDVVVTGTGMPVLPAIRPLFERTGKPVLLEQLSRLGAARRTRHRGFGDAPPTLGKPDRRLIRQVEPALRDEASQLLVIPETQSVIRIFARPAWFAKNHKESLRP